MAVTPSIRNPAVRKAPSTVRPRRQPNDGFRTTARQSYTW
ncbi:Uncharacterised protein [Bordetella pertussis]|nr:Uncharacterised protein [Bordetella pertussis]CFU03341.1 Uncharacterised protein [Bordetella pertussis]